jgi:hypothetical protein
MKPLYCLSIALTWFAVLLVAGFAISQRLELSGDLRKFMPGLGKKRRAITMNAARAARANKALALFAIRAKALP